MFNKATKMKSSPKVLLLGASGSGKTWNALEMAYGFTGNWEDVYVIDTESSASKYATKDKGFMVAELETNTVKAFIDAIQAADGVGRCIVIDSITHLWSGVNGLLSIQKQLEESPKYRKNSVGTWTEINNMLSEFFHVMRKCKAAVIVTCRTKDKLIRSESSKDFIKVSDAIMFREGYLDYEFDIAFLLEQDHTVTCYKDRTGLFDGMEPAMIDESMINSIKEWSQTGETLDIIRKELVTVLGELRDNGSITQERYDKGVSCPDESLKKTLNFAKKQLNG